MYIITKNKKGYDVARQQLKREAVDFLRWSDDVEIEVYDIYHLENVSSGDYDKIKNEIFDEDKMEIMSDLPETNGDHAFRYRQVTGQYNERENMTQDMIRHLLGFTDAEVDHSKLVIFDNINAGQVEEFKNHFLNPVENVEIALDAGSARIHESSTEELRPVEGFTDMSREQLEEYSKNFSMDLDDLLLCQNYFKSEDRNPNLSELKVIDTYWSDHCRHTTFNTELDKIEIEAGPYEALFQEALEDYMQKREDLNRTDRAVSLMDLGTIQAKHLIQAGLLDNVEISAEVNACALEIKVDVDGDEEDWILYFKNETHNHPTEIEPFGGASTCVGGGVRDPLSGRSWVYQAMRISGAKNPTLPKEETHPEKLPQRTISMKALEGNSDYANQIGVTGGFAEEIYHPGFEAKRLEVGALISAAPQRNIVREEPAPGDKVILLGGRTGRDGLGAAVGSSQIQTEESLEDAGAEVQKGAAAVERKITRLFRNGDATRLIKRCNDFGAGGVAVAVGELTDGLEIDLDEVPVKYDGMHGGEIALAESQERMAVVVRDEDVEAFLAFAEEEDVESAVIASVTEDRRMKMFWDGDLIIDLSREFLDSDGAPKHAEAFLTQPDTVFDNNLSEKVWNQESVEEYMTDLNRANQQAMAEHFDGSIGRASVLYPYGGVNRSTQELGMVSKLPVESGLTTTTSGMAYGYHPDVAVQSPYHGGYYAVVESVSRMVALGFDYKDIRLTFQEYFESLKDDPKRWGKPVLALLGANTVMDGLNLGSIGGKDSMSGTFEDIDVPPTLISFAVAQGDSSYLVSRAFKASGSQVVLIENPLTDKQIIDLDLASTIYDRIHKLAGEGQVLAASTVGFNGMLKELIEMSYGNNISIDLTDGMQSRLGEAMMGSFILELAADADIESLLEGLDYQVLGQTQENSFAIDGNTIDLAAVLEKSKAVFDSVFQNVDKEDYEVAAQETEAFAEKNPIDQPKALVPVLYGTNGEYDMDFALQEADFEVTQLVVKDSSHQAFESSVQEFIQALADHDLLAMPNGAVFGNEPGEQGRAWEIIFNRKDVKEAINQFITDKKLIIGTGSGFAALIRTGLIEHGKITGSTNIHILPNDQGKFISDIYTGQIISQASAFTANPGQNTYAAPVATAYGRLDLSDISDELKENGQILSAFNTYHDELNIDALASPNGLIFGSLSSYERVSDDLFQNVAEVQMPEFLTQARNYFRG